MEKIEYPKKIFVDSSAFVSVTDQSERQYERASTWFGNVPFSTKLLTTQFILDESITRIRTLMGTHSAHEFANDLLNSDHCQIIWIQKEHFLRALEKFKKYSDQTFSFTDCTSFVVMEEKGIKDAFTFDDDFKRAGFRMHPE